VLSILTIYLGVFNSEILVPADPISYYLGFGFVQSPSSRLSKILSKHNLPKPVYSLEFSDSPDGRAAQGALALESQRKRPLIVSQVRIFVLSLKMVTCMLVVLVLKECICALEVIYTY